MADLVEWLREQIAEKRRRAMATAFLPDDPAPSWSYDQDQHRVVVQADDHQVGVASHRAGTSPNGAAYTAELLSAHGRHMELNDPQAAVAECDAHDAILDLWQQGGGAVVVNGSVHQGASRAGRGRLLRVVKALGLAYQYRPGYREEWRP